MNKSKIVILGESGYLGRSLSEHLKEAGDVQVKGFSSRSANLLRRESVDTLAGEVDRDTTLVVISGLVPMNYHDDIDTFAANAEIGANVARLIARKPVGKCVYFSTISVYGDRKTNTAVDEETPVDPVTNYGAGKLAGECVLRNAAENGGVPFLCLRICRVYGPGAKDAFYGPARFIRSIIEDGKVELYGDGSESRDCIYIDDLCRIVHDLMREGGSGLFNVATGGAIPFAGWLEVLQSVMPEKFEIVSRPRTRPQVDIRFDISKLKRALPSLRFTRPEEGLKAMYEHFKAACR